MTKLPALAELVAGGGVVVLTGAGCHRVRASPTTAARAAGAGAQTPMTYQTFAGDPAARRRYWARSHLGWRTIAGARPTTGTARSPSSSGAACRRHHHPERRRPAPGGRRPRTSSSCTAASPGWSASAAATRTPRERARRTGCARPTRPGRAGPRAVNPDGDVDLRRRRVDGFRVVDCGACGGVLKPDVVFFGENVPTAAGRALLMRWSSRREPCSSSARR